MLGHLNEKRMTKAKEKESQQIDIWLRVYTSADKYQALVFIDECHGKQEII